MANEGKKSDEGKAPIIQGLFQYFPHALREVALVSKYGLDKYNLKYSDHNWSRVSDAKMRYQDALGRHILAQFIEGPIDGESGLKHLAHVAWNALAVLELNLREK